MKRTFLAAVVLLAATGAPALSQDIAASSTKLSKSFDGKWSVLIVTEEGQCDRAYRYPLVIENGYVGYGGRNNFTVTGEVYNGGDVVVTVSQGQYSAQGTGRLQGKFGAGKWAAPAGNCSGRWKADKRG